MAGNDVVHSLTSMRPPHEAGEVNDEDPRKPTGPQTSMRPPHEAGEVLREPHAAASKRTPFNEAPARGGGGRSAFPDKRERHEHLQ